MDDALIERVERKRQELLDAGATAYAGLLEEVTAALRTKPEVPADVRADDLAWLREVKTGKHPDVTLHAGTALFRLERIAAALEALTPIGRVETEAESGAVPGLDEDGMCNDHGVFGCKRCHGQSSEGDMRSEYRRGSTLFDRLHAIIGDRITEDDWEQVGRILVPSLHDCAALTATKPEEDGR